VKAQFAAGPALPPIAELLPEAAPAEVTPAVERQALGESLRALLGAIEGVRQAQKAGMTGARLRVFLDRTVKQDIDRAREALGIGG